MTEIKILKNKIIFNGHADTLDACNAITSLVNAMKESPDFKTIEVRNGYAEFECIKDLEEKLFSPTQEEQFKSDMDALADSINNKSGSTGKKTITQMKTAVDGITLGVFEGSATADHVLIGDTFYSDNATLKTGTMVNNGGVTETLYSGNAAYAVPEGYHDGTGIVGINVQTKSITVTSNGTTTVSPDSEKVLSGVNVTVNVPNPTLTGTATTAQVLVGQTFYNTNTTRKTGTMVNNGGVTETLDSDRAAYPIPEGYHDGTGVVGINIQNKDITITSNGTTTVSPDEGKVLSGVNVTVNVPNQGGTDYATLNSTLWGDE